MRIGAFKGGMTEVMIEPICRAIISRGGSIRKEARVTQLLLQQLGTGVELSTGEQLHADHLVLAVPLKPAQELLRPIVGTHPWFQPMLSLPSHSAATIQMELDQPALSTDRTNFSPTSLCCFAEQSRTTFRNLPGRFSGILYPPGDFINEPTELVLEKALMEADKLRLPLRGHITNYRVINHAHDFYAMHAGTEALRPEQGTPIRGLTLAGDYTKQSYLASMEGAVISGEKAAQVICEAC
jgi:15-cis-phytoene desaturase